MRRVFITGSTDGLGYAAARSLAQDAHAVVVHARSRDRATVLADLAPRALGVVLGDLSSAIGTCKLADQVNAIGRMDAVIHNAGVCRVPRRNATPEGHARTLAVNTLAPYILTVLLERPDRFVYLSSGMHGSGSSSVPMWTGLNGAGTTPRPTATASCTSRHSRRQWLGSRQMF